MFRINIVDYLIQNGYLLDRAKARSFVLAGQVFVNGIRISKLDTKIRKNASVEIIGQNIAYSSTDGYKLEHALQTFGVSILNKCCVDLYANRGSMTQALIAGGSSLTYMIYNNPTSINKGLLKNQICKPIYVDSQDDTVIEILSNIFPPAQLGILHSKNEAMHDMIPYLRSIVPNGDIVWHLKPIDEIDNFIIRKLGIASRKSYITSVKNIINTINSYSGMAVNNLCASQYLKKRNVPEIFLHIVLGDNILPFDIDQSLIEDVIDTAIKSTQI